MKPGDPVLAVTSTRLSPTLYVAVVARAEAEGISQADLVRRAIAAYVASKTETKERA